MDFFTATTVGTDALAALTSPTLPSSASIHDDPDIKPATDAFAEAINARYSRKSSTLLIPLSPAASPTQTPAAVSPAAQQPALALPRHRPHPTATAPVPAPSPSAPTDNFTPVLPAALHDVLEDTLVVDIRPRNAFALARLPSALSLSVPSMLLKRPLLSLDKLTQMLSSHHARDRFSTWHKASRILVYDADSALLNEGSNLLGLMRKFRKEGFTRDIFWLKGGFRAAWRERIDLVDQQQITDDDDSAAPAVSMSNSAPSQGSNGVLCTSQLSKFAFTAASTTSSRQVPPTPFMHPSGSTSADPFQIRLPPHMGRLSSASSLAPSGPSSASGPRTGFSRPHGMSLNLPPPLSHSASAGHIPEGRMLQSFPGFRTASGATASSSSMPPTGTPAAVGGDMLPRQRHGSLPGSRLSHMAFNPFFDNIRQNIELGGGRGGGSGEGIPLRLPRRVRRRVGELPFEWLREIGRRSGSLESDSENESSGEQEQGGWSGRAGSEDQGVVKVVGVHVRGRKGTGGSGVRSGGKKQKAKHRPRDREKAKVQTAAVSDWASSDSPPPHSTTASVSVSASKTNSKSGSASPPPDSSSVSNSNSGSASASPAPPPAPELVSSQSAPSSDSDTSGDDLARTLALQFYKIELSEQRRLMGVMEHHSKESMTLSVCQDTASASRSSVGSSSTDSTVTDGPPSSLGLPLCGPSQTYAGSTPMSALRAMGMGCGGPLIIANSEGGKPGRSIANFPFSITAGVEKGDKNRYRNIWPFEHARVRLHKSAPEDDDYMNASYVQPLGTTKRYIATQGPLPSTFADFWKLCWQENVHVIVMLTREVESALTKCGKYWNDGQYGPLTLKMISTTDTPALEQKRRDSEMSGGFFNVPLPNAAPTADKARRKGSVDEDEHRIKRVFELTNANYPSAPPRIVTQLQFLDWPDLDVPKDPRGLLRLMQEVDDVVENTRRKGDRQWGEGPLKQSHLSGDGVGASTPEASTTGADDIDPTTGVSRHAVGRAPVLLHCSAGVGRTGGFIAVDAVLDGVRREMRKRREQKKTGGGRQTTPSSASRSPLSSPMEVDRSSASPVDDALKMDESETGLTLSIAAAGGNEVHVPIAGLNEQTAVMMEVDESSSEPQTTELSSNEAAGVRPGAMRRDTLRASSLLRGEVRSAHLKAASSSVPGNVAMSMKIHAPRPILPGHSSNTSSSGASSSRRSTSFSGLSLASSGNTSSTTSLTKAIKAVDASLGAKQLTNLLSIEAAAAASSPQGDSQSTIKLVPTCAQETVARMDSWRTAVTETQESACVDGDVPSEAVPLDASGVSALESPRSSSLNYAEPRRLHDDASPLLLSTYDEPIRRVIEDMREQRMSLCQSLRQYVFVHRAIIEGALRIVDEESRREREDLAAEEAQWEDTEMSDEIPSGATDRENSSSSPRSPPAALDTHTRAAVGAHAEILKKIDSPSPIRAVGLDRVENMGLGPAFALQERGASQKSMSQVVTVDGGPVGILPSSPLSPRTKRQASPTELVKEDAKGMPRLMKRPSIKRRARTPSEDEEDEDDDSSAAGGMKLGSLMLSSPPPPSGSR